MRFFRFYNPALKRKIDRQKERIAQLKNIYEEQVRANASLKHQLAMVELELTPRMQHDSSQHIIFPITTTMMTIQRYRGDVWRELHNQLDSMIRRFKEGKIG